MLGRRNIRDSIGYVTLGLFSHALLAELSEARSTPDTSPRRKRAMTLAIESLGAIEKPDDYEPAQRKKLVFQNYQEVTTLRKMLSRERRVETLNELRSILDAVVQAHTEKSERVASIDRAISFFSELARKAVINAEYSEERVPPSVRQLVS